MTKPTSWDEFEGQLREAFEENLAKMKDAFVDQTTVAKDIPKGPEIIPLTVVFYDSRSMLLLGIHEWDVMGTPEEVSRLFESKMSQFEDSFAYRKNQGAVFNRLKDEYGMRDRDILDLLVPGADKDERERVYKRLKQARRYKTSAKRSTKR